MLYSDRREFLIISTVGVLGALLPGTVSSQTQNLTQEVIELFRKYEDLFPKQDGHASVKHPSGHGEVSVKAKYISLNIEEGNKKYTLDYSLRQEVDLIMYDPVSGSDVNRGRQMLEDGLYLTLSKSEIDIFVDPPVNWRIFLGDTDKDGRVDSGTRRNDRGYYKPLEEKELTRHRIYQTEYDRVLRLFIKEINQSSRKSK